MIKDGSDLLFQKFKLLLNYFYHDDVTRSFSELKILTNYLKDTMRNNKFDNRS